MKISCTVRDIPIVTHSSLGNVLADLYTGANAHQKKKFVEALSVWLWENGEDEIMFGIFNRLRIEDGLKPLEYKP